LEGLSLSRGAAVTLSNERMTNENCVDMSSFPLLRIDELSRHEMKTLLESEVQLASLVERLAEGGNDSNNSDMDAILKIAPFVTKLLCHVRKEIFVRQGSDNEVNGPRNQPNADFPRNTNSVMLSPVQSSIYANRRCSTQPSLMKKYKPDETNANLYSKIQRFPIKKSSSKVNFFITNSSSTNPSNFLSRAKQAGASLRARDTEHLSQQREKQHQDRIRRSLETMQNQRIEREKSALRRQELFQEERRLRRKSRKEREEQVRSSMKAAAEEAKSVALMSGYTKAEANMEAAAAAAMLVKEESFLFDGSGDDSDGFESQSDDVEGDGIDDGDDDDNSGSSNSRGGDSGGGGDGDGYGNDINSTYSRLMLLGGLEKSSKLQVPTLVEETCTFSSEHDEASDDASDEEKSTVTDRDSIEGQLISDYHLVPNSESRAIHSNIESSSETIDIKDDVNKNSSSFFYSSPLHPHAPEFNRDDKLYVAETEQSFGDHINIGNEHKLDTSSTGTNSKTKELTLSQNPINSSVSISPKLPVKQIENTKTEIQRTIYNMHITGGRSFSELFPTFSHIFSDFAVKHKSKSSGQSTIILSSDNGQKDLTKCIQTQIHRYNMFVETLRNAADFDKEDVSQNKAHHNCRRFFKIKSRRPEVTSIIKNAFSDSLLSSWSADLDGSSQLWNLQWTWGLPKESDFEHLLVFQKVSRFRGTRGLTRKDLLKKNIQRFALVFSAPAAGLDEKSNDSFNIMPLTYALPHEYNSFVSGYSSIQKLCGVKSMNYWIIKPIGMSRGRGISVVSDIDEVSYSQPIVIQRYISDPFLFLGFKFDLRLYVLVTSFAPIEAFIYKEGLARFGSRSYSSRLESLRDNRIHLTNSSIQKEFNGDIDRSHPAYLAGSNGADSKVAISWLWKRLDEIGIDTDSLWEKIIEVCVTALAASGSDIQNQPNSFELFGFDVMFDQQLKCWLIEVNSSPSLTCDSPLDIRVKGGLIRDTIALVNPPTFDRKALEDVCKRRLTQRKTAWNASSIDVLEQDLSEIHVGQIPRKYGEMPGKVGNFQRIAPGSPSFDRLEVLLNLQTSQQSNKMNKRHR